MGCKSFVLQGTHFLDDNSKIERKKKIDSRNKFYQTPTVKDVVGRHTFVGSAKCSASTHTESSAQNIVGHN